MQQPQSMIPKCMSSTPIGDGHRFSDKLEQKLEPVSGSTKTTIGL